MCHRVQSQHAPTASAVMPRVWALVGTMPSASSPVLDGPAAAALQL